MNNRTQFLPKLLKYIKVSMISASYFVEHIENEEILKSNNCQSNV